MQKTIHLLPGILRSGYKNLKRNDPLILASSTAFFTTFSISPILVILVNLLSITFDSDNIPQKLFGKIQATFGKETTRQIQKIVENVSTYNDDPIFTIAGFIFLLFVATTLLMVVKQSIHNLWSIKPKHLNRFRYSFVERVTGIALLVVMAILFLASLLLDASVAFLRDQLHSLLPSIDVPLMRAINITFSIFIVTTWFTILYKLLPDARVQWHVAFAGGLLTGILFNTGKWILGKLLLFNNLASIFGTSASFALILLFIFYSALILYFGASFTFAYGDAVNAPILPGKNTERFEVKSVTEGD